MAIDAYSPVSMTAIYETKELSIIFIQLILIKSMLSPANVKLIQGDGIAATKHRRAGSIGTFRLFSSSSAAL
jgi:hypothetical protein